MKNQTIEIYCKNIQKTISVPMGSNLATIYKMAGLDMPFGATSAKVNNKVEGLHYVAYHNQDVEFLDGTTLSGQRTYIRSLIFLLYKALIDLYPKAKLKVQMPVANGYYCQIQAEIPVDNELVENIKQQMKKLVKANLPFHRITARTEDAVKLFKEKGLDSKAKLIANYGKIYTHYYTLGDCIDYFYGSLLTHTSQINVFDVIPYQQGLLLRVPNTENPKELRPLIQQDKMFEVFDIHHRWQQLLGVSTIGDLNEAIQNNQLMDLIHVSEALQEKNIGKIADHIKENPQIKVVLISGPSSSGKTTFSKRLAIQLMACGLKPQAISLDDYFVNREETPKDEQGNYDYEHFCAINLDRLTTDLKALLVGQEVELPKFNFVLGKSESSGTKIRITPQTILILEGIHALNPLLTANISDEVKFKIYASALTTMMLDDHNYIPTSDNRLLRRIVRDYKYRGCSAVDTIRRWESVQAGERKWIFPYQENADIMFNTALLFELGVLRNEAMSLLEQVPENLPEYSEAYRLHKFLSYLLPVELAGLPPTSLLREFIGGSTFTY